MRLKHSEIDYDALVKIHEELAIIVAEVADGNWDKTSKEAWQIIEGINAVDWAIFSPNKVYAPALRSVAAACLYALVEIAEENK